MTEFYDEILLKKIFSDAHVIDVDFSRWDKAISLAVVADHVKSTTPDRLAIVQVDFLRVQRFACDFNHLNADLGPDFDQETMHVQWRTDTIGISTTAGLVSVSLSGQGIFPSIEIACEKITTAMVENALLRNLFPAWYSSHGGGLARPGILAMSRLQKE